MNKLWFWYKFFRFYNNTPKQAKAKAKAIMAGAKVYIMPVYNV